MTWVKARRLRPEQIWGGLARRNRLVSAWGVGGDRWMLLFVREGAKVEPLPEGRLTPEWGGAAEAKACGVTGLDPCPWHPDGGNHPTSAR